MTVESWSTARSSYSPPWLSTCRWFSWTSSQEHFLSSSMMSPPKTRWKSHRKVYYHFQWKHILGRVAIGPQYLHERWNTNVAQLLGILLCTMGSHIVISISRHLSIKLSTFFVDRLTSTKSMPAHLQQHITPYNLLPQTYLST